MSPFVEQSQRCVVSNSGGGKLANRRDPQGRSSLTGGEILAAISLPHVNPEFLFDSRNQRAETSCAGNHQLIQQFDSVFGQFSLYSRRVATKNSDQTE